GSDVELFGAPHVAIITAPSSAGAYGALDCGLFVESFVLSAQARGIATVPQAALAGRAGFIRDFLNLPDDRVILLGIALGWPDLADPDSAVPTERAAIDEFVTFVDD
ncbi:MAG TPA: nitroreductase family protein, partial [Acidimicrobiales bacterium]